MLANQIINLDLQLIAAKINQFQTYQPAAFSFAIHQLAPSPLATNLPAPQPVQSIDMAGILTERPRQVQNLYWQLGQPIGAPVSNFRQIKYLPLPNAVPDLDHTLSVASVDCRQDLNKQLIKIGGSAKVWMTVHIEYEPINPIANKQPFEQYLSAAPTRMFKRDGTFFAFANPYIDNHRILTDRMREFNANFIRDKSGLRLARVLQFTLKFVKYAFLEGRVWQHLPEFISKKAILNINNTDERCFGYGILYLL